MRISHRFRWGLFFFMLAGLMFWGMISGAQAVDRGEAPVKLTVGAFAAPRSAWDADWQTFKKNLDKAPNPGQPEVKVKLLIRGEAGGEPITMTNIRRNRMQFGGFSIGGAAAVVPELSVLLAPYIFENREELDYVMDHVLLDAFQPLFAEKGLVLIRWVEVGWLHMYGRKDIRLPQDAKGYRLRSQASEAAQIFMDSLHSDWHQMEFQDVIPSLQTGLVEGGETNVVLYSVTGLAGEAPYLTLTRHAYDSGIIVANKEWFGGLSEEARQRILRAFPSSGKARAGVRKMANTLLQKMRDLPNVEVHDLTAEELAAWKEATKDNYKRIIEEIGGKSQEIYDVMIKGRDSYRRRHQHQEATE